jgi:hypothetical protein
MTRPYLLLAACLLLRSTAFALEGAEAQLAERAAAATPIIITGGLEASADLIPLLGLYYSHLASLVEAALSWLISQKVLIAQLSTT